MQYKRVLFFFVFFLKLAQKLPMKDKAESESLGKTVRTLLRNATKASLGTVSVETQTAYCSLVLMATDAASRPILLLSDLAVHSRNIAAQSDVSLLISATAPNEDPLTQARATLQGAAVRIEDDEAHHRYLRRYPSARDFANFSDFHFYRFEPERAHLVAGFGQINWLSTSDFLLAPHFFKNKEVEEDIIEHMNTDHLAALQELASLGDSEATTSWEMTGVDPEGIDLRAEWQYLRILFKRPVLTADEVRRELVQMIANARN